MLSSIGYHTFTIFRKLTYSDALKLYSAFKSCDYLRVRPFNEDKRFPNSYPKSYIVEYIGKNRGIRWYVRFNDKLSEYMPMSSYEPETYSVRATINPKVLVGIRDYLTAATSDCLESLETQFNIEAARISPVLGNFEHYFINQIDYCLNLDTVELQMGCSAKQLFTLISRGYIPRHFSEAKVYDNKSHRKKPYKNDFRLQNNSTTISCYRKHEQLLINFPDCPDLEKSRNAIRFEVKCKYPKVYSMSKGIKEILRSKLSDMELAENFLYRVDVNPIKNLLSDGFASNILRKYFDKIIRKGDYFTLDGARWMVQAHGFRQDKESRLLFALDEISSSNSIPKAMSKLTGQDLRDLKRSLKDLDDIYVNPVTIPRRWGIKYIPNPLKAYYDSITNDKALYDSDYLFEKLLSECLYG